MRAKSHAGKSLIAFLSGAVLEGGLGGASIALALLLYDPGLRALLDGQADASLSLVLYLLVCIQVGITTAVAIALGSPQER